MQYKVYLKRRLIIVATLVLTLLVYAVIKSTLLVAAQNDSANDKKVILIDPGHGGYDGGAEGKSGIKEKDINLKISLKLKDILEAKGFNVVMTREDDRALLNDGKRIGTKKAQDIANRCKIKQDSNADAFISIHQNHFPQGKYYGSQVWYSKSKGSSELARITQENLKIDINAENKRVEKPARDDYKILTCSDIMPSILVECGFLSNYEEEKLLQDENYQQKIADSLAKSISNYLENN